MEVGQSVTPDSQFLYIGTAPLIFKKKNQLFFLLSFFIAVPVYPSDKKMLKFQPYPEMENATVKFDRPSFLTWLSYIVYNTI